MSTLTLLLVSIPPLLLLTAGLLPSRFANRHPQRVRTGITWLAGMQCLAALLAALLWVGNSWTAPGSALVTHLRWSPLSDVGVSVHYDGLAGLMLLLVSFVGFVVCAYSIRYLDGERGQGRYFRWVGMTVGAVSWLVLSGNLLMFFAAWVMTSFGLHQLLLHYPDRPAAQRAAWTKFVVSRLGDCFLLAAIGLVYREFGTFEFDSLFAAAKAGAAANSGGAVAIAWLLMLGAATKSAQFPLHIWLPDTLETPTPVSALMHAGIVNAGGYLVIRLSPLIVASPAALATLAMLGTATVCVGGAVMLTQTSVKRKLAYSTIAQMGFMMLQCGLGAFSAAMLHILAHSLYKAYAFLNSGNVLADAGQGQPERNRAGDASWVDAFVWPGTYAAAAMMLAVSLFDINIAAKSGGYALGFVLWLSLTALLQDALKDRVVPVSLGFAAALMLAVLYVAGFASVDGLISPSLPRVTSGLTAWLATAGVVLAFCGLRCMPWFITHERFRAWAVPLYVHASNGFYFESVLRRLLAPVISSGS